MKLRLRSNTGPSTGLRSRQSSENQIEHNDVDYNTRASHSKMKEVIKHRAQNTKVQNGHKVNHSIIINVKQPKTHQCESNSEPETKSQKEQTFYYTRLQTVQEANTSQNADQDSSTRLKILTAHYNANKDKSTTVITEEDFDRYQKKWQAKRLQGYADNEYSQIRDIIYFRKSPEHESTDEINNRKVINRCIFVDLTKNKEAHRKCTPPPYVGDHSYSNLSSSEETETTPKRSNQNYSRVRTRVEHAALLPADGGEVIDCYYAEYHLVIVQEYKVTFYQQSGLGMFLESQGMWIPRGEIARQQFDAICERKHSRYCVMYLHDHTVAYVELFCKEHTYVGCMMPSCDLFVVVYYRAKAGDMLTFKIHQLVKFTGYASLVQFVVVERLNCVTVYYESMVGNTKTSVATWNVTSFYFTNEFQFITASKHHAPSHRIDSLHLVEDCELMVVGCDGFSISFWHAHTLGHTITLPGEVDNSVASLCSDRGFVFVLQLMRDENVLRLTAVNVMDGYTYKTLQYFPSPWPQQRLLHAHMLEGEVIAFYNEGTACWHMESGQLISKSTEINCKSLWPYSCWLIKVIKDRVYVHRMEKILRH